VCYLLPNYTLQLIPDKTLTVDMNNLNDITNWIEIIEAVKVVPKYNLDVAKEGWPSECCEIPHIP
jgi:hypothetical protein